MFQLLKLLRNSWQIYFFEHFQPIFPIQDSNELEQEFEPAVKLESRIADELRTDAVTVESQVWIRS